MDLARPSRTVTVAAALGGLVGAGLGLVLWSIVTTRTAGAGVAVIGTCAVAYALLAWYVVTPDQVRGTREQDVPTVTACRTVLPVVHRAAVEATA